MDTDRSYDPNDDPIRLFPFRIRILLQPLLDLSENGSDLMAEISSSLHLLNGSDLAINGSRIWIIRLIRIVMSSLSNYSTVQIFRSMDLGYQNPRAKPSQFHSSRLFLRPEPGIISPAESVGVLPCLLHLSCDFS
ncbi:hypothetical protein B296_00012031 [Ensete ventricosum]|uniref:Uncharacterized protein n=1 Tax=Ensete ventricosum TaxID=4639 RepID=A0A427B3A1_ENSVE|nr:hypothetical protein B296_00012031 [Ensete ventricosum]